MLADAFASEHFKFWRNRNALFFGFVFAPLITLLFNVAVETYLHWRSGAMAISAGLAARVDIGTQMVRALGLGGSSFVQIFFVAGAAAIFAGEYRWETWRLLTARSSRVNLVAAKFLVYGVWCAFSLIAFAAAALLATLYGAMLNGVPPAPMAAGFAGAALTSYLASWAELMVLGALTALVAVTSRAMIGALMAGIFFSFGQTIAMALAHPWDAPLRLFAALPSMSAYLLRAFASGQEMAPGVMADPDKLLPAALFLLVWIAALAGATAVIFQNQDLPRE